MSMEMRPAGAAQSTPAKVSNVIATPAASSWRTPPSRPRDDGARRGGGFEPRAKRGLDGDDEAIVHPQQLLARPRSLQFIAGLCPTAQQRAHAAAKIARRTAAPPLVVVAGHGTQTELGIRKRRAA